MNGERNSRADGGGTVTAGAGRRGARRPSRCWAATVGKLREPIVCGPGTSEMSRAPVAGARATRGTGDGVSSSRDVDGLSRLATGSFGTRDPDAEAFGGSCDDEPEP